MSISSELTALQQDITNARTAITNKGGQTTVGGGSSQLATDIATIPSGSSILYGLNINDWIGTDNNGTLQKRDFSDKSELVFTGLKKIADSYILGYRFYGVQNIPSVIFPDLEELGTYSMDHCFSGGSFKPNSEFRMPKLKKNSVNGLYYTCYRISNVNYVELGNSDNLYECDTNNSFYYCFFECNLNNGFKIKGLQNVTGTSCCGYMFGAQNAKYLYWSENTPVEFTDLETVNAQSAFSYALRYRGAVGGKKWNVFPKLTSANGTSTFSYLLGYCTFSRYTTYPQKQFIITFPKLQRIGDISGNLTFSYFLYSITGNWKYCWFPALKTIGRAQTSSYGTFQNAFTGSTANDLFEVCFPELENLLSTSTATSATYGCFSTCTVVKKYWLPKLNNVTGTPNAKNMFANCTQGGLEIHFGIENQSYIEGLTGYATKFGATNSTIYFDCVNHITVNGTVYDRDGEHYVTECPVIQTSGGAMTHPDDRYSWKDANGNVLYTLECWTPAVGDSVYDANDTVVGTITAIS